MIPMKIQNGEIRYLALEVVPSYSQHWGFISRLYFTLKCVAGVFLETEICPLSSEGWFCPCWILVSIWCSCSWILHGFLWWALQAPVRRDILNETWAAEAWQAPVDPVRDQRSNPQGRTWSKQWYICQQTDDEIHALGVVGDERKYSR